MTALMLLVMAGQAAAEPASALDETATRYFHGERDQGYAWLGAGDASLVAGGALLAQQNDILRGMSYPLLAVGLIQFVAGLSSLARSEARLDVLRRDISADPGAVRGRETKRIDRLNFLFKVIRYTEFSLLGLGAGGAVLGGAIRQDQLLGAGLGLAIEAASMLALDAFAERRAHRYAAGLAALTVAITPRAEGSTLLVGIQHRF